MAQDILITPGSGEPQILFRGSGTNDTPIELNVLSSYQSANGSGTALLFEGTEGQLFAITDNLSSGVIFSVAGAAGLPFIEADASGDVRLIEYGRYVGVGTGTPAYQLDVFGTGRFSEGILFADGSVQTGAYTGDGGGGGTTYTADSGIELQGSTFIMGGTGSLDRLYISGQDPNISPLTISGAPSQSKPLTEWYGSDGTLHSQILPNGSFSGIQTTGIMRALEFFTVPQLYSSVASEVFLAGYNHQNSIGIMIGKECRNDSYGIAIGYEVGFDGTANKDYMIGIGYQSLYRARSPYGTVAIGRLAASSKSTTSNLDAGLSVMIGHLAGYNISDSVPGGSFDNSVIIGAGAGQNGYGGNNSVFIGFQAGDAVSGAHNIAIGDRSLENADGYRNIEILTSGTISSIIGTNDNKLHIENTIIGDTSSKLLAIGDVDASNLTPDATLEILPAASTDVGLIVQGATSQSANLQEWQDSAGTLLTSVNENGYIEIGTGTVSATRSFIVHTGSAYFPNTVYIGEQYNTVGAAGPDGRIYINGYNYAGLEFNSHTASSETAGWTHHRIYQEINTALIFDDTSTTDNMGFEFTTSAGDVLIHGATARFQNGIGFGNTASNTTRNFIGSTLTTTNEGGRTHDLQLTFRQSDGSNSQSGRFIFTKEGDFSVTGNINALYGTVTASSGVFNTGEINKLTVDNGTASAFNVSGTSLLAGTGVVLQVKNTGGDTLFAVEDTNETTVVVNAQVGQTSYPFEVRDEFGITAAYVDVSGNVSGNSISFGDGTTQTTAATPITYTAASGITLEGSTFTMSGTGTLDRLLFSNAMVIGQDAVAGTEAVSIGNFAGYGSTDYAVSIGPEAGRYSLSSHEQVAIGYFAAYSGVNADSTVSIGSSANRATNSNQYRTIIGNFAGYTSSNLFRSIIIGQDSAYGAAASVGNGRVIAIGESAARGATTNYSTFIGKNAGRNTTTNFSIEIVTNGATSSIIGSNSNKLHIENTIIGDTSSKLLAIGNVGASNLTPDATLEILPAASTDVGLIVQGAASQSANLQEWQDSSAGVLAYIDNQGMISGTGITYSDGTSQTSLFANVETNANSGITLSCSSHAGKYIRCTHAVSVDITIPSGLSCYDYTEYMFEQAGAGQISVTGDAGVTLNTSSSAKSRTQYSVITIKKVAADTYTVFGDVE